MQFTLFCNVTFPNTFKFSPIFNDFPIKEITNPDTGMKINTNKDYLTLIINIDAIVNTIVRGSLIINSKIDKKEC